MANSFDPYEYVGVIAPGAVVAFGLMMQWPELRDLLRIEGFTVGDLGLLLIGSFVLGHLVQSAGNAIEGVLWWASGGMPSVWIRKKDRLLTVGQRALVQERLASMTGQRIDLSHISKNELSKLVPQAFNRVKAAGRTDRIETWNRTYGLLRGLTAAFFILAVWLAVTQWPDLNVASIAAAAASAAVAWTRAARFARYYARDLWLEFLNLPDMSINTKA